MKKPAISSTTRLSINIAMVSLSVLLLAQTMGMFPDSRKAEADAQISLCEALAVNCSILAAQYDLDGIRANLKAMVERNPKVLSAALRDNDHELLAVSGAHAQHWSPKQEGQSDQSNIYVPISRGDELWGNLEVSFASDPGVKLFGWHVAPWVRTVFIVTLANLLLFMLYLQRMLRHLDPSRAVPSRVRAALDSLSEGLLVLDSQHRIVLANEAFLAAVDCTARDAIGRNPIEFTWSEDSLAFWRNEHAETEIDTLLTLKSEKGDRKFMVNFTDIVDEGGGEQGSLVTFNDVTTLENNRAKLMHANATLQQSRDKIQEQNQQLQILATRDPLTNCWNRRAFFEELGNQWDNAYDRDLNLCAIMLDIDHFKRVNDDFGHAMGDRVLREVSQIVQDAVRPTDYVCRYGGEEFCVLLPNLPLADALEAGERFRLAVKSLDFSCLKVTASLGVSSIRLGATTPDELLEQADKSLYVAKRSGRDQVISWDVVPDDIEVDVSAISRIESDEPDETPVPFHVVTSLLSALSFRDPETAAHSMRVADLSFMVGQGLLNASALYALEVGALLHDIGKIGVPDSILLKPSKLTEEEWKIMSHHSRIGYEIVEAAFDCPTVEDVLRHHHLPFGPAMRTGQLCGEALPLGARIVKIADAYDSMVTDRVYRKGRSADEAFAELRRCAGSQFDPDLVERFIDIIEAQPFDEQHSSITTTSKQLALQLGQSTDRIARAFDDQDLETLQAQAERLILTAKKYENIEIEQIARRLASATAEQSVNEDELELPLILAAVLELLEACRLTQRACLNQANEVRQSVHDEVYETEGP